MSQFVSDLERLWSGFVEPPDLVLWWSSTVASAVNPDPDTALAALRLDQKFRWRTVEPWKTEDYLQRLSPLPAGMDWQLELAAGEWLARAQNDPLTAAELQLRFPDLRELSSHLVALPENVDFPAMIDDVCDRFEQLHRAGSVTPRIEFCLANLPVACRREGFIRLLRKELDLEKSKHKTLDLRGLLRRFPKYAAEIQELTGEAAEQNCGVILPSPSVAAETAPEMLGRFRVVRELGRGGCGRVVLACDNQLNVPFALKQVLRGAPRLATLLSREARMVAELGHTLEHQGIVRVIEVFEHNHLPVMVMDYKSGGDLARKLRQVEGVASPPFRQLPPVEAVGLIREIALILQAAHEKGIYHRDLKPANVLIDGSGKLWLTDFGLALRDEEWASDPAQGLGTLVYTAPEQILGISRDVDGRADIWSLGVMLYQMLSGELPVTHESPSKFIEQIQKRRMRPLQQRDRSIPAKLSLICEKCLRPNVDLRYHSVAELLEDLQTWNQPQAAALVEPAETAAAPAGGPSVRPAKSSTADDSGSAKRSDTFAGGPSAAKIGSSATPSGSGSAELTSRIRIRPRGLESYTEADCHFFLKLLPGDLEPDNLPQSIHYWCDRLEVVPQRPGESRSGHQSSGSGSPWRRGTHAFPVGVIHGSSGIGKSSFIKAGLLPLLPQHVLRIYLEASPHDTEFLLVRELRGLFPQMPADLKLPAILKGLQDGLWLTEGQRLLIVLDQFAQWLDEHAGQTGTELELALRYCTAGRVQTLLLVREEYCTATSEFVTGQLGIELSTRWNDQMLPLFSEGHARMVLAAFGQFYGRLAEDESAWSQEQHAFLEQAVAELSQKGRITPVHLAVFAQMFRELPWTPERLQKEGGAAGAGIRFLENQFSSPETPERQRRHFEAARRLLEELLPAEGSPIRGHRRSRSQLQKECGYGTNPPRFADLLQILEQELKLITRTD
ncbi:MAG: protein kinase domain-containing protein, partial [Planctomycetota bacterium]